MNVRGTADYLQYSHLAQVIAACPLQAGPLYTAFKDLSLCKSASTPTLTLVGADTSAVEWKDLCVLELPGTGWCAIIGHKRSDVRVHHREITVNAS